MGIRPETTVFETSGARKGADRRFTAVTSRCQPQTAKFCGAAHTEFSEHGQCLTLLTDTLTGDQAQRCFEQLLTAADLKRTTIYFSFYLMETWQKFGRGDLILKRLDFWKDLVKQGLKTPVEMPGDTRSDCHAWGSYPLFELQASIAGIRPARLPHRPDSARAGRPAKNRLPHAASGRLHYAGSHLPEWSLPGNR